MQEPQVNYLTDTEIAKRRSMMWQALSHQLTPEQLDQAIAMLEAKFLYQPEFAIVKFVDTLKERFGLSNEQTGLILKRLAKHLFAD